MTARSKWRSARRGVGACARVLTLLLLPLASCAPLASPPPEPAPAPAPEPPAGPAIDDGAFTDEDIAMLGDLLARAETALDEGDAARAVGLAEEAEQRFAPVPGSGEALWIRARAHRDLGELEAAVDVVHDYLVVLGRDPELAGEPLLFLAEVHAEAGERLEAVGVLLEMPNVVPDDVVARAAALLRDAARGLERSELERLSDTNVETDALLAPIRNELALRLHLGGDEEAARRLAERSAASAATGEDRDLARAILDDRVEDFLGPAPVLGALLPSTGSPGLRQFAEWIREGIELAVAEARREGVLVRLEVRDDQGDPSRAAALLGELTGQGIPAVLGPLTDDALRSAAQSGGESLLLSPTAQVVPEGSRGTFSLTGVHPEGSEALARFAWARGLRAVAVLHPRRPEAELQARYFAAEFERLGGRVVRSVVYAPGTTNFQGPMEQLRQAGPDGLALFLPPDQIEIVAPQVTYYGLHDMELGLFGGESWTDESILRAVDPRHTNGVVAATSRMDLIGEYQPYRDFVAAYEDHFQRTLRSFAPALGYDAARLVIEAYRRGARTRAEILDVLDGVRDFPGATGRISIENGRIVREYRLVEIQNRQVVPIDEQTGTGGR